MILPLSPHEGSPANPGRSWILALIIAVVLTGIFTALVTVFRSALREEIRQTIINRNATVLRPVALRQLVQAESNGDNAQGLFDAVMESAKQDDMIAIAIFDSQGHVLQFAPKSLLFADLPIEDFLRLLKGETISRFHTDFPLSLYFLGIGGGTNDQKTPVLEVLLPLHARDAARTLGFAQYYIDARALSGELAAIDQRINRLTLATLSIGAALISAVIVMAYFQLRSAQRAIADRNERLMRTNFELSLAAKASALGQITSHLMHGLQGPIASLRTVVAAGEGGIATDSDWATAAAYTDRMQSMIHETVGLLNDSANRTSYELSGHELLSIILERNAPSASAKGVKLGLAGGFEQALDSHRGGLLCLIANNLIQNAIDATPPGNRVALSFCATSDHATLSVSDEGGGIPRELAAHLFEPGRSGKPGGSGLGLAISQLLARQIGATLTLAATGPAGSKFVVMLPFAK